MADFDKKKANQIGFAFSLVLNDSSWDSLKSSRYIMQRILQKQHYQVKYVAVAYHDLDENEFGDRKTPHYHLVIEFADRMRLLTCFNYIVELFSLNENQVSIEKCSDVGAQSRYLVHMDDADKFPYPTTIVETNNNTALESYFQRFTIHDENDLINIVERYPSKKRLFVVLGKKQYKEYRWIIHDLLSSY